jgi:hypothetical protein
MPPFQVPSTTFLQPSWSLFQHIPSQQSCNIYIHNIIHIHRPFSQGPFTSHIHISEFATILGQYSYFYRLGETGCYKNIESSSTKIASVKAAVTTVEESLIFYQQENVTTEELINSYLVE